ncbi:DUF5681 domain-containing protein [Desulfovibrio sp. ZJ369]|uniref:DUF5681 domain-containing protein n=1 Tax=Desulfovibrio sp. ZJ369 TaxID=2709793 RepID=UPI0013EDB0DB|nr:DUF5681 domain-containing protein [Desulfovibrio sp. ZJ369]
MARGNPDKLKPVRSKLEASERGKSGGRKSGEARRRKKALREHLEALLAGKRGDMTTAEALTLALVEKGLSGDVRAFEVIRDTIGEKPVEKSQQEVAGQVALDVNVSPAVAAALKTLEGMAEE